MFIKIVVDNATIRRVLLPEPASLAALRKAVQEAIPTLTKFDLVYFDAEGDAITVASDAEVKEVIELSVKASKVPKFHVKTGVDAKSTPHEESPVPQEEPEPVPEPPKPKTPLEQIATVLSDPVVVAAVQQTIASPIVADAIIHSAEAFLEGGPLNCAHVAFEQLPILQTLWLDLIREHPQVEEAANKLFETNLLPEVFGFAPKQSSKPVHFGVYCDGCDRSPELKAAALLNQTISDRGFIVGDRFKSVTAHDFDLCDTCWSTDKFAAQSPFMRISQPHGRCGRGPADASANWRQHHPCGPGGVPRAPHCAPRGCRGSGVNKFESAMREILSTGVEAFANASKSNPELAEWSDVAKAIAMSLKPAEPKSADSKPAPAAVETKPAPAAVETKPAPAAVETKPAPAVVETKSATTPSSPGKEGDEWTLDPMVKWSQQLQQLEAMGFGESDKYIEILEEEKGDLVKTINKIVRKMA